MHVQVAARGQRARQAAMEAAAAATRLQAVVRGQQSRADWRAMRGAEVAAREAEMAARGAEVVAREAEVVAREAEAAEAATRVQAAERAQLSREEVVMRGPVTREAAVKEALAATISQAPEAKMYAEHAGAQRELALRFEVARLKGQLAESRAAAMPPSSCRPAALSVLDDNEARAVILCPPPAPTHKHPCNLRDCAPAMPRRRPACRRRAVSRRSGGGSRRSRHRPSLQRRRRGWRAHWEVTWRGRRT